MAPVSTSSPTYSLPCSRLGPEPSSSAYRYGSSTASYTEPFPARQLALPAQASSLYPQPGPRTLLTKRSAGLVTLPCAHTQSACTATCSACIPTLQGSNASVSVVDENPTQGSHALEDWWSQAQVYPEDLLGQSSIWTSGSLPGLPAPSQPYSTHSGCAPAGTDPYSRGMVCNKSAEAPTFPDLAWMVPDVVYGPQDLP